MIGGTTEAPRSSFSILTVCTGNLARSPLTAQLLAARTQGIPAIEVTSAGTEAVTGDPMTPEAAELSLRYGGDPTHHRAALLTPAEIESADLVLTATRQHRAAVATLVPRSARYAFTIRQFAELVASLDLAEIAPTEERSSAAYLRALVASAAAHRGYLPPHENPDDDDLEDPFLRAPAVYERVGALIDQQVTVIADAMVAVSSRAESALHDSA